jgi:phosphoribosylglycinamide formyltransferase 1
MLNIAVFGSGRGSNFEAILRAIGDGKISGAQICLVLSNNSSAGILEIARAHSLLAIHLSQKQFATEEQFAEAFLDRLRACGADLLVLAGYMKRVPPRVVSAYRHRIINIHPALLPKYGGQGMYGHHVHEAVLASGDRLSGATVHFVDEEYDHGSVLLQKTVPVLPDDTAESLAARVLRVEHEIYPEVIRQIADHTIPVGESRTPR